MKSGEKESQGCNREKEESYSSILVAAEQEILGNIAQSICLVRWYLADLDQLDQEQYRSRIGEASLLLGKAVKDLRTLARQLNPFQP